MPITKSMQVRMDFLDSSITDESRHKFGKFGNQKTQEESLSWAAALYCICNFQVEQLYEWHSERTKEQIFICPYSLAPSPHQKLNRGGIPEGGASTFTMYPVDKVGSSVDAVMHFNHQDPPASSYCFGRGRFSELWARLLTSSTVFDLCGVVPIEKYNRKLVVDKQHVTHYT